MVEARRFAVRVPVIVGSGGTQTCAGTLAQVTFRWALCSCTGVSTSGAIHLDGFSSRVADAGAGGSVGVNGTYASSSTVSATGSMWLEQDLSLSVAGRASELTVGGQCSGAGTSIVRDARVAGSVNGLSVGGQLFVPTTSAITGSVSAAGGIVRGPVVVSPPCDCRPEQQVDIVGVIADGKAHNDNATVGLDPSALQSPSGPIRLDLPCGRFFLSAIHASRATTIAVHGRTALFVEGDLSASSDLAFFVDEGAELDVFVGGNITSAGSIRFGSPQMPAVSRFYVHGLLSTSSGGTLAGNFYLPKSAFSASADMTVYGSVFCGSLNVSKSLGVHYDSAIQTAGQACSADGGVPRPLDGGVITTCSSCRDCGNQACVGATCGRCTDNSQCCAPLSCREGTCVDTSGPN